MRAVPSRREVVEIVVSAVFPPLFWIHGGFEHVPPLAYERCVVVAAVLDQQPPAPWDRHIASRVKAKNVLTYSVIPSTWRR